MQTKCNVAHTQILKYSTEMYHKGLSEHKSSSANNEEDLEAKILLQAQKWNDKWLIIKEKEKEQNSIDKRTHEVNKLNQEAKETNKALKNIL
jgi:restriction system protein